ncbi:MAG: hypothetical protein K9M02_04115 [Thiohalocapsa sp.]|nr:hypothetical protein [Thiohalocapsa sp.]
MQIDWLTVAAQIVNFLILVYLLKRFLYKPVTNAMARREERIADRLEESREREAAAERERERLHERMERLEERRDAILEQAREEAEKERRQLMDAARDEADAARARWREEIEHERGGFLEALKRRSAEEFEHMARRALADLADVELEEHMLQALVARLKDLDDETLGDLRQTEEPLAVATSFPLDERRRETLRDTIHRRIRDDADIELASTPSLLCGIELTAAGRRLGWSLADYLDRFASEVDKRLDSGREAPEREASQQETRGHGDDAQAG